MTLVAKNKRISQSHKKRLAQHHRQNRVYLKPYWPYLPIVALIAGGFGVNSFLIKSGLINLRSSLGSAQQVTRIAALTPHQSASTSLIVVYLTIGAVVLLSLIYWRRLRRWFVLGEEYIVHHPWLDIGLVAIIVCGVVLTRPV